MFFTIRRSDLDQGGVMFQVVDDRFVFALSIHNSALVLQRNEAVSVLTTDKLPSGLERVRVTVLWKHDELYMRCGTAETYREASVPTEPAAPPPSLVRWARQENLLPVIEYSSEEKFRQRVYACLSSIQDKVNEAGAFNPFWDVKYAGQAIESRTPKREMDIHPTD